jgi:hypothetical protein
VRVGMRSLPRCFQRHRTRHQVDPQLRHGNAEQSTNADSGDEALVPEKRTVIAHEKVRSLDVRLVCACTNLSSEAKGGIVAWGQPGAPTIDEVPRSVIGPRSPPYPRSRFEDHD